MKKFLIIISILTTFALTVAFYISFIHRSMPFDEWVRRNVPSPAVTENNPAAAFEGVAHETAPKLEPKWEKWVDKQVEMVMKNGLLSEEKTSLEVLSSLKKHGVTFEELLVDIRAAMRAEFAAKAQELKNEYTDPPQKQIDFSFDLDLPSFPRVPPYVYDGPQTVKALMENFDESYGYSDIDKKYPREEWIQMYVDNGYEILDHNDYRTALTLRLDIEELENNPEQWSSGSLRIPPTDDWETYKAAYIERKVSMLQRFHTATREDPEYTGGFIPHSHPDVFLRYNGKRVYVMRNGLATSFYGKDLTNEQQRNLTHYGVHPDGIEVIYIDGDYNVLNERPPLVTPEMKKAEAPSFITPDMLRNVELPPDDWKPLEGWAPPTGLEEALHANGWGGSFALQEEIPSDMQDFIPPDIPDLPEDSLVEQTEKAAKAAQEEFENAKRELEKFVGMSDAEIEAEFEKMLMEHFPEILTEEKMDSAFRDLFEEERFLPERFNGALDILELYGQEEGLQRLKEIDPVVAEQIERFFFGTPTENAPSPED